MGKRIAQVAGNRANGTRGARGGREGGQNGGGIGNTAATAGIDCILNRIGRTGRGVIENIGEELVVKDPVTGANDGFVVPEKARPEVRRISQADAWSKIIFVSQLRARKDRGEVGGATKADAQPGVEGRKIH